MAEIENAALFKDEALTFEVRDPDLTVSVADAFIKEKYVRGEIRIVTEQAKPLRGKNFHEVLAGNAHEHSLKSSIGKVSRLHTSVGYKTGCLAGPSGPNFPLTATPKYHSVQSYFVLIESIVVIVFQECSGGRSGDETGCRGFEGRGAPTRRRIFKLAYSHR